MKELEKEQTKPKVSRRKDITNIRGEINQRPEKQTTKNINKTNNFFFEKIKKWMKLQLA